MPQAHMRQRLWLSEYTRQNILRLSGVHGFCIVTLTMGILILPPCTPTPCENELPPPNTMFKLPAFWTTSRNPFIRWAAGLPHTFVQMFVRMGICNVCNSPVRFVPRKPQLTPLGHQRLSS